MEAFFHRLKSLYPFRTMVVMQIDYRGASNRPDGVDGGGRPKRLLLPERLYVRVEKEKYFFGCCYSYSLTRLPFAQEIHHGQFWPEVEIIRQIVAKSYPWAIAFLEEAMETIRNFPTPECSADYWVLERSLTK